MLSLFWSSSNCSSSSVAFFTGVYARFLGKVITFFLLFFTLASPLHAETVWCVNCSDKFTQALDRVTNLEELKQLTLDYKESVMQTVQQIQMVQQNIEQYANMVQNTIGLPAQIYGKVHGTFVRLANLTTQLRTSRGDIRALGGIFRNIYAETEGIGNLAVSSIDDVQKVMDHWGGEVDRASEAVFQLTGSQLDAMVNDTASLELHIDELLSTPTGQMQALQAGNTLAAMQVQESRQLRELMATATQSQIASQMKAEKEDQLAKEMWRQATDTSLLEEIAKMEPSDPF